MKICRFYTALIIFSKLNYYYLVFPLAIMGVVFPSLGMFLLSISCGPTLSSLRFLGSIFADEGKYHFFHPHTSTFDGMSETDNR